MRTLLAIAKVMVLLMILAFVYWVANWHLERRGREKAMADSVDRHLKESLNAGARAWMESTLPEANLELIGCYPPRVLWDRATFTCADVQYRKGQPSSQPVKFVFIVSPSDWSVIFKYDPREFVQKRKMEIANMSAELQPPCTAELRKLCADWQLDFGS